MLSNTYVDMPDMWIMFDCGSGSVIAACHLYQNMVPGKWIPFSITDKQQDEEDKGHCWHLVWELESWMILLNIMEPAHGGLQLLNIMSIWLFSRLKFFECIFWRFCSSIAEDSILLGHGILTLDNQILKFVDRSSWLFEDENATLPRNIGIHLPIFGSSYPRKMESSRFRSKHYSCHVQGAWIYVLSEGPYRELELKCCNNWREFYLIISADLQLNCGITLQKHAVM